MKIKLLTLTLFCLLNSSQLFAEIFEVNNEKIKMLLENSEFLIYHATNGIKHWIESSNRTVKPDLEN